MSHPSEAERRGSPVTAGQVATFTAVCGAVEAIAGPVRWRHIANSALLLLGDPAGNLVRPGIMLYGASPAPDLPGAGDLRPVLSLATAVAFLKRVPAGTPLSYGGTFTTRRESLIATLPVGYADGYRRGLLEPRERSRARAVARRSSAPSAWTCASPTSPASRESPSGTRSCCSGSQGGERITADELAAHAGTISYEIFCGIGPRVPRIYSGDPADCDDPAETGSGRPPSALRERP